MNLGLAIAHIGPQYTTFISSTGTVLFNAHSSVHGMLNSTTTTVTTIGGVGDTVLAGLIHWPTNPDRWANVTVGSKQLQMIALDSRDDAISMNFLATNGECYQWRGRCNTLQLVGYHHVHSTADEIERTPVALYISGFNPQSSFLYIQPTGFQILHDVVVSFIYYERRLRVLQWAQARHYLLQRHLPSRYAQSPDVLLPLIEAPLNLPPELGGGADHQLMPGVQNQNHCASTGSYLLRPGVQSGPTEGCSKTLLDHHGLPDLTGQIVKQDGFPVASGGFGDVWRCWLNTSDSQVIQVAVKAIRINTSDRKVLDRRPKKLFRELQLWRRLHHENILPLYGFTNNFGPFFAMVCPWVPEGTLNNYLEKCHADMNDLHMFCILHDIAAGLQYLHSLMIVHGDLTGANVLIQACGKACLAEFGLSTLLLEFVGTSNFTTSIRGNIRWAAPELVDIPEADEDGNRYLILPSPRCDIYSFGSIMIQILSGKVPYHWIKNEVQILTLLLKGVKPLRPSNPRIVDRHWDLIQRCWSSEEQGKADHR